MYEWLDREIVGHGRLPLLFFLLGFLAAFLFIRLSVRMIRAEVSWWPGNVKPGGHHVHHVVFGVVTMLVSGVSLIAVYEDGTQTTGAVLATFFGIGAALVLDEFALIFYLQDVYWADEGRTSVDAVFVAIAVTGLLLLGLRPLELINVTDFRDSPDPWVRVAIGVSSVINLLIAAVVLLKGKIWTGLLGLFIFPILLIGALRLSRPSAPWARWRYTSKPKRMLRALERERKWRRPVIRAKIFVQDFIAGTPSAEHVKEAAEHARVAAEVELDHVVHAAPPPISLHPVASGTMDGLPGPGSNT
ncbi:hypothetical protein ACVH9Z_29500 [Rhodococcus opacus]|uniref:Integral membrane protein n=2 Tax=Rhodococcus opacus TaxID=37919 RepID=A0AAX3YP68_RHOOP|nr:MULTISPECIES: hypothetical protein [Rhodococcus]ELB88420.1 hypothetical protein Rwratislav_34814 [Rhodococcus wratislaviensis IFP 2016]NHU41347.1 hypothetical protein [Rhodococcus sp. A14]EID80339.1 hypothetical protein W59_08994 [Rhodococcus opacus RKJ300 = JCM 13270]MCZ4585831.1 hypothetical protein [Rhodococcus opacus]MDI9937051.1 hypothetical protein [Rhodococcus sp. IEGM 1351]